MVPDIDTQNPTGVSPIIAKSTRCSAIVLSLLAADWTVSGSQATCMYLIQRASPESAVACRIVNSDEVSSSSEVSHAARLGSKVGCSG